MKKHSLLLDYDGCSKEWVEADAERLKRAHPNLGDFVIEPSDDNGWHLKFPKSELEWDVAIIIAEQSECDKGWLAYCRKYKCFAVKTITSKALQPKEEVVNPPVKEVTSPVKLVITPDNDFNLRCCLRLCESIKDKEWIWSQHTPIWSMKTTVVIGCRDMPQAIRRLKWLSKRINARFEVGE